MGQRTAYRIHENGQDTYAYSHWSGVISPFSRLERAQKWRKEKPEMSLTNIMLLLCDGEKLYDPSCDSLNAPYMSPEAGVSEYFNRPPQEWGDIEMLVKLDIDKSEVSFRFDPRNYRHLMDTTLPIGDGIRILNEVYEEQKDKVKDPEDIWCYETAFTDRVITPCTITIVDMLERMRAGDVDFIKQHIWRFDDTDRWGRYSREFDSLLTEACQLPKGDNQMLEAVADVYRRHYCSGRSDYEAVVDAVTHFINTDDFERFKLIFDTLPSEKQCDDYNDCYKQRIVVEAMKQGNDAYALYGLKNGTETGDYPWLLKQAVVYRCIECRDFLLSEGVILKDKENADSITDLLYQAAKVNDEVMLAEFKKQRVPINYNRSKVFFICLNKKDHATAAILVKHGGDLNKFKKVFERSSYGKRNDSTEFFMAVENDETSEVSVQV